MISPGKACKTKKGGKLQVLDADEAGPVLAAAAKLRAEAQPAKRPSLLWTPDAAISSTAARTISASSSPPRPAASSQSAANRAACAQAQNTRTTSHEEPPTATAQPQSAFELALSMVAPWNEAQIVAKELAAVMRVYRADRTYELLLRKAEQALQASTSASARAQMQLRVDHIKSLSADASATSQWIASCASEEQHVPTSNTLKAKQALLLQLRAALPAHAAEADAFAAREKAGAAASAGMMTVIYSARTTTSTTNICAL
jgi:hypothetical protein